MKNRVTVVCDDKFILVDGIGYTLESFILPENVQALVGGEQAEVHALQWLITNNVGAGDIEFKDLDESDSFIPVNLLFNEEEYATYVQPFVDMWQAEHNRLEELANTPLTLDEAKEQKKTEINARRDTLEQAGFEYLGGVFQTDEISYMRLLGANISAQLALSMGEDFSIDWTLADNSTMTLNASEMVGIIPAFAEYSNSLHVYANELKAQVEECETNEDVDAVVWVEG